MSKIKVFCFIAQQAAVNKNIPVYKEAVKSNIVVKIDQERFLSSEMWDDLIDLTVCLWF